MVDQAPSSKRYQTFNYVLKYCLNMKNNDKETVYSVVFSIYYIVYKHSKTLA